jgi:branched-chain amino acid transport system permease protein
MAPASVGGPLTALIIGQLVPVSLYALVSLGFVAVYKSTKVLNFVQGQLVLSGD